MAAYMVMHMQKDPKKKRLDDASNQLEFKEQMEAELARNPQMVANVRSIVLCSCTSVCTFCMHVSLQLKKLMDNEELMQVESCV